MSDMNISSFMSKIDGAVAKKDALLTNQKSDICCGLLRGYILNPTTAIGVLVWDAIAVDYPSR